MKHSPLFSIGISIFLLITFSVPDHLQAQFIRIDTSFYSPALKQMRNITVFLPDTYYKEQDEQYSTIYFLHGWGGNHESLNSSQEKLNQMLESGTIRPVIIVCADHSVLPFGCGVYVNSTLTGNFEDYAAFDVVDWVEISFRAIPEKNARALFGQSLGAYGAFRIGIHHKDRFRVLSAHAGQVNNEVWMPAVRMMIMFENGPQPPYFYNFYGFTVDEPSLIPGFFTRSMFLAASGFSPDENSTQTYINPRIVEYPFDEWGNIIDSVYNKWKSYDIAHTIAELNPADSVSILYGCGTGDETLAYFPNLSLRDSLLHYDLSFEFFSHKAGHSMPDVFFDRAMIFMDSLLMHPTFYTTVDKYSRYPEPEAFPNPVKDLTTITLLPDESAINVSVVNTAGTERPADEYSTIIDGRKLTLNFSGCSPGIYLIRFRSDKRAGQIKIIVAG
ncbi:MAG: alpha/beta hydrolase-fold protein [Bacteroidota bacterium]